MTRRLTNEEFVERCRFKWGDEYDYSECNYTIGRAKVRLIHRACGASFDSRAESHLHLGSGCPRCYGTPKKTRDQFIAEAVAIHGVKYDYSDVEYVDMMTRVVVKCRSCATVFKPTPAGHICGARTGCPTCANLSKRYTQDEFIERARAVHGEKYDYSEFVYTLSNAKSTVRCRRCGLKFQQSPHHHVSETIQSGCPSCWKKERVSQEEFLRRCVAAHGDAYGYEEAVYRGSLERVKIFCKKCDDFFEQQAHQHSKGSGCPRCVQQAYVSIKERAWLDALGISEEHRQQKIKGVRFTMDALVGNTVYEFHGTYWHGDPRRYAPDFWNFKQQKTMGQLYERTLRRDRQLRRMGYDVKFVWERDWDDGLIYSVRHPSRRSV